MAITKNYVNEMLRTLLVLSALLSAASAVDCNGKSFHCVNSTHFMICVDLGGGVSQAMDNFFIACPPPTVCRGTNRFECEFPAPKTAATTLSNVISEATRPWEDVVTASSLGNANKEFSENYINTEKITTTAEYSITTDATVDWTAINASELNIYNEMNTLEIEPNLAPEIATAAKETNQTVNENVITTEYVPTVGAGDITTAVLEIVSKITTESQNLTETDPVVVDEITATAVELTTENIIITDTTAAEIENVAPSATEQVAQTIHESLNITETVPTGVKNVTQTMTESQNFTVTEPVVVDNLTIVETTTENVIITDTTAAEIVYIAPSATEQVAQTINEKLNKTETEPTGVENLTQTTTESKNLTETEPVVVDGITATTVDTTTENIIITDTIAAEIDYIAPSAIEQVAQTINERLNITETVPPGVENVTQTTTESQNISETEPVVVDNITIVETTTENIIITDTTAAEIVYIAPSVTEQVAQTINEILNKTETVPTDVENVIQTTTESQNFTETEPVVLDNITIVETTTEHIIITDTIAAEIDFVTPSTTEQVPQTINQNRNRTEIVPMDVNKDITTTIIETVTQTTTESGILTQTEYVETYEITATTIKTTTDNIITQDSLGLELGYTEPTATEQVTQHTNGNMLELETVQSNTIEEIITTDSAQNIVTENIIPPSQAVNIGSISTDALLTTVTNAQSIPPAFEDNMKFEILMPVTENIEATVNSGASINGLATAQPVNVDTINTEAMYIPTTITSAPPLAPAFEDNINTDVPLITTENVVSSGSNGATANGLTTAHAVNVDNINAEAMYIPTTISSTQPVAPTFEENNRRTDDPLPRNENTVFSLNNRVSTNGFMTTQAVNVDIIETDTTYITTTPNNFPPIAPDLGANTRTETPLSAPKNIIFPKKYADSSNGFMIPNPLDMEQITQKAGLGTIVQLTTDKYFLPSKPVVVNGDIVTKEIVGSVQVVIKESPNTIIQKTQKILNSSTDTDVKLDAIESDVNENYNDNKMNSIDTNNMFEITNATVDSGVDKSVSHVSQTGPGNTDNNLLPNEVTSGINELTHSNGKPTAEDVNEQAPVNNVAIYQTGPSPIYINGNIAKVTKTKSILTSGIDSAFDISTQNWMSQQGESNTIQATKILKPSIVEHNDQADNIIWNPLANQVFNNPNQNPESIGTSSVTNINDRNAASLNSQSEIPVYLKTVVFATAGTDVSSVPTILPATSGANITIRDNIKNTHKPIENSVNPPSESSPVEADNNNMKSQQNMQAISNQYPSIVSISTTSDIKPEVKSSIVKDFNSDSPTVVHNNLPNQSITSQFELPTNTHSFSEASSIGTPMEGSKVIKEVATISKTVMLDLLPLPINNIQFIAHPATKPVLMDLNSNSQAENSAIITESYKSETFKPIVAETGIQDSGHGGNITPVPKIRDPAFNFQIGITDRTSGTTTVPIVRGTPSNSQNSGVAKTGSSVNFNSQTRGTDGADVLLQHSAQQVEKIPNTMARATNNAHVVHSPNSSNNVNTGIITPESVSESNYESPMSENIMPQVVVIGYQKNNTTVSQNDSFGTEKEPPNSIGSDHIQTQQSNPSTNNSSSRFTPAQKISTSTARTPSQMATSNPISLLNNNLTKQVPTVAAQTFSCIYGIRGRYSDKGDCRKFYICFGINEPIVGYCPENTVFSDLKKQCTKKMSHCIRDNQFKCPSVGRFNDFIKDNVYYICVNHKNHLYRFKFQCQKGYILDKTTLTCLETKEIESNESVSISSDNSSQTSSSSISSSTSSKSISSSSNTSKSSSRADDRSKNSSKSKKSKEAEETSEKSEGKDEDDEVFKCKERGKFPIRNECRRYYLCKKGRRSEYRRKIKKCDSDQVFHKNKKKCVDEDSYEC